MPKEVLFESGAAKADGSIAGNAHHAAPAARGPHCAEITAADHVQIHEAVTAHVSGQLAVNVALLYQSIGYRWVDSLRRHVVATCFQVTGTSMMT